MRVRRSLLATPIAPIEPQLIAIRAAAGVAEGYSPEVYFEAEHAAAEAEPAHVVGARRDATDLALVTLDPAGAKDLDQALHLERRGDGWRVSYAIADVGAHVAPGGQLDRDTHARVETLYCPDRRIGLHPPVLSEGFASLLPGQRTKAALWTIDVSADGEIAEARVERAWVTSRAQYAYASLHASPPPEARELLADLAAFGAARRALGAARGAATLPKPEQDAVLDGGEVTLVYRAATPLEGDNAQVSLLTGEAAARLMLDAGVGILRTMPPADDRAVRRLRHQAKALGVGWPEDETYASLVARLHPGTAATAAFLSEATTLFRGASWSAFDDADPALPRPEVLTHGALGVPYAHVTAPLRRLVDRYATEVCLAHCAGRDVPEWVLEVLPEIGATMARGTAIGSEIDRKCIEVVEAAVLAPHVGELFAGIGLDDRTVQLHAPAVVGRCSGDLEPGREVEVTLVSAKFDEGPKFAVARDVS